MKKNVQNKNQKQFLNKIQFVEPGQNQKFEFL